MAGKNNAKAVKTTKPALKVGQLKINLKGKSANLLIITLVFLIIGVLIGGFSLKFLTKNDCFAMVPFNGQVDCEIGGEGQPSTYEELGVKCVSFGRDVTDSVTIKYLYREDMTHDTSEVDSINPNISGYYYVVYTSSNIKYQTVRLIRNVTVFRTED